jgi:hypothetical protein
MSNATGSALSPIDLLQKLVTFLVAAGWTQDMSAIEGVGWRAHLHLNGNYVHLRASENEQPWQVGVANTYAIDLYTGTAFNAAQPWNNQVTGAPIASGGANPVGVGMFLNPGPFAAYYFFADATGDNVVVVVEKTSGLFEFIGWGPAIEKAGAFTGGAYFFGTSSGNYAHYPSAGAGTPGYTATSDCPGGNQDAIGGGCTFVRADVDSFVGNWICCGPTTNPALGYTGKVGNSSVYPAGAPSLFEFPVYGYSVSAADFWNLQTSALDGRADLLPLFLWVQRDGTTTGFSLLGSIPNVYQSNGVGNGYSDAEEYTLGSDTYMLFPNFAVQVF